MFSNGCCPEAKSHGGRMRIKPLLVCACVLAVASVVFFSQRSAGQSTVAPSLITQPIDEGKVVVLRGNTHPLARAKYDQGPAPASLAMDRMMLVLKTTSAQGAALETLLAQQQDRSSPNYHKWLTPQEFGEQFGASESDIQKITGWLQSHGFQTATVAPAVTGVASLNNFPRKAAHRLTGSFTRNMATGKLKSVTPEFTYLGGCSGTNADG